MNDTRNTPQTAKSSGGNNSTHYERQILDTLPFGALITRTADGVILFANQASATLLGLPDASTSLGMLVPNFYWDPEERQVVLQRFHDEDGLENYQLRLRRVDGSMLWVAISLRHFDFEGEPAILSTIIDITERKRVEVSLNESETRYRLLSEATLEGVVIHDKGILLDANQTFAAMFGYEQAEVIGMAATSFLTAETREITVQNIRSGYEKPYEVVGLRKDGTTFPVEITGKAIPFQGSVVRVTALRDITESKLAQAELRQNELRLSNAIHIARMGYWDFDMDTQMFIFNEHYYKTFHATTAEEMGGNQMSVTDFIQRFMPPEEAPIIGEGIQKAIETKDPNFQLQLETKNLTAQGELRWVSVWITVEKDEQGRTTKLHGVNQDITERKQLESQVQQAFERRGYQVQVSTEISQEVASTTELSDIFSRVVTLTKERLGYYHAQLLRYDADRDAVVLINGYGEIGQKMLAGNHQMPMGEGLIGTAAASGETVLRPVLADDPDWHPNPLLPETQGEIAVPIKWQNTVLGVLDVQSNQAGALSDDDRLLLEGLCGQIAIAMHSAELVETIRQNEARLAEAAAIAQLGYWEFDALTDTYTFTDQFYALLRTTAEQEGGYQMSSREYARKYLHPDDGYMVDSEIQKSIENVDPDHIEQFEHRFIRADGTEGYVTGRSRVIKDTQGRTVKTVGFNQDITERKQAEEALRINEARLAEALRAARLGNWEYDFENDLFIFTDDFYSIFRTTAERVGGYKISSADYSRNFVHPSDAQLVGSEIQKVLDAKDRLFTTHLEHRIIFSDGEVGHIAVNINVERDENGKIIRWYGANQDITERKQVEEALRQNEARLAEALRAARLANWEYDVEKDLFTFNDEFYAIFHTTVEKAGGYQLPSARYAELFVHPDDMEVVGIEIGKALSSTERVYNATLDHRIVYEDGGIGYITVQLTVERDENGKITRYYGANQDVTERVKQQNEMAERLEEINRLYRAVSHEGWMDYRNSADLPTGFVFDQAGARPVDETFLADDLSANVPMRVLGGEIVGTLTVANDPRHPTSPEDYAFLQQVSDQIALALESARLFDQTQTALAQSEKLFEASGRLALAADLQGLVNTVVDTLKIPEINRALLVTFTYEPTGEVNGMDIIANWWNGSGHEVTAIGTHYSPEVIRLMHMFISPSPVFFNDTFNDERVDETTMQLVKRLNLRAIAVLPLHSGTHQIGMLMLEAEEPYNFTQDETRLFIALAPQIATVLENRRQFVRAQQQAERESTLNVISQKIQSATTVEAVLQIAARELGHALGAPMTVAQLTMKDQQKTA